MNHPTKRILVIDDEDAIRKSFTLALEDSGYDVDTVASGKDAIRRHEQEPYQLIFLDLKMPEMSGTETLIALRDHDPSVPIYIVTAFYEEFFHDLQDARNQGADFELMQKPVGSEQILLVCKSVLENQAVDIH